MTRTWMRELAGWMLAAAASLATAASAASSARADLLFRDGDSLIVALLSRSLLAGEPLDWAMSSVLFLPETAAFTALDAVLPLDADGLLAVSAVLNLLALYGAIRLVAGRAREGRAPVAWSVAALAVFGLIAATETSSSRDALELASLQLTTTYYAATVVAVVLTVGILRRVLDGGERRGVLIVSLLIVSLLIVSSVSTLTNPLFVAWATVPLTGILLVLALRTPAPRRKLLMLGGALVGGAVVGALGRIPFSAWIANSGAGYAQPARWRESLGYYGDLAVDRLPSPAGVIAAVIITGLLVLAVVSTVRARDVPERLVALAAWVSPLLVVVGAIALGTHAARYLQPVAFFPVLALVAAARVVRVSAPLRRAGTAVAVALILVAGVLGIPRLAAAATRPDADLACVTAWIDESGRTGAGQFWTVRLPKLHLQDPSRLVQVDHELRGYAWLVNRTDFDVGEVSFLVEDAQTVGWDLRDDVPPVDVVECGRYTILDLGTATLPIGPQRS